MMSSELFILLKFEKIYSSYIFSYFFSPEIYYMGQVTSSHEKD